MNDEPMQDGPGADDARIRALLAELGSGPDGRPMPPEVAARLDDTLARLVAERAGSPDSIPDSSADSTQDREDHASAAGNVVPLRRRWVPRVTAAAAAVVVLGAGSVAVANLGLLGNGPSMSSESAGGSSDEKVAQEDAQEGAGSAPDATPTSPAPGDTALIPERTTGDAAALPEISAGSYESDVSTLLQRPPSQEATASPSSGPDSGPDSGPGSGEDDSDNTTRRLAIPEDARQGPPNALIAKSCPGPEVTDGGVPNLVRYDGRLAVLVVHPEQGGSRLVDTWDCAGDRRLASTTITP